MQSVLLRSSGVLLCLWAWTGGGPPAAAQADPSPPDEIPDDWRAEGTAVASVALDVGILDPDRTHDAYEGSAGFSVQVVTKRTRWPVMIGLGGGLLAFGGMSQRGPITGYLDADGSFSIGTTTESYRVQLRHAEFVVRAEPFWGPVRPFVEGLVGLAALWHSAKLTSASGDDILSEEWQRDAAVLYGASAGLDVRLRALWPSERHASDLVLTLGCRRLGTSRMERPVYTGSEESEARMNSVRVPLALWQPFVALSIALDSRAETKRDRASKRK